MQILTVSQVTARLKEMLESDLLLSDLWISGEVSESSRPASGHTYFVLKDANSQLRGVFFRPAYERQRLMLQYLERGAQVIVHGKLTLYEQRGELQCIVDFVRPEGVGVRQAQFERLRQQLEEEGLFDTARKRPLPAFPRRIGVVTSPTGAVFHDIRNVIARRWPLAELVLAPTPVQGPEAVPGIRFAIEALNARGDVDVIILARGGGSVEELWAFNEEPVARAVFASLVPVVSAVGHETDVTICDFVADRRAPTPSAAAEMVVPDQANVWAMVRGLLASAAASARNHLARDAALVDGALARSLRAMPDIGRLRQRCDDLERRATSACLAAQERRRGLLESCLRQMQALDPQATLNRGYAVVHKDGRVVSSIAAVATGDTLVVKVSDGGFPARVDAPGTRRRGRKPAAARANGRKPQGEGVQKALLF
ncbi:MAG TPA: exodeoxyribonuclease VII large subunit [Dehalococcoidia bacterium]|nr:exodeoxyribonuclease VII large subunit [Dehalococcoidia bacterium]